MFAGAANSVALLRHDLGRPYLGAFISQGFGDDFSWMCAIGGVGWRTLGIGMRIAGLGVAFS